MPPIPENEKELLRRHARRMIQWRRDQRVAYEKLGIKHLGFPWYPGVHGTLTSKDSEATKPKVQAIAEGMLIWQIQNEEPQPKKCVADILELVEHNLTNDDLERRGYYETEVCARQAIDWANGLTYIAQHIHHDERLRWPASNNPDDARQAIRSWAREVVAEPLSQPTQSQVEIADTESEAHPPAVIAPDWPKPAATTSGQAAHPFTSRSSDYTSVEWGGKLFEFKRGNQAAMVKALAEAWPHTMTPEALFEAAGTNPERPRVDVTFRDNPAFGKVIVKENNGAYRIGAHLDARRTK